MLFSFSLFLSLSLSYLFLSPSPSLFSFILLFSPSLIVLHLDSLFLSFELFEPFPFIVFAGTKMKGEKRSHKPFSFFPFYLFFICVSLFLSLSLSLSFFSLANRFAIFIIFVAKSAFFISSTFHLFLLFTFCHENMKCKNDSKKIEITMSFSWRG